MAWNEPGNGKDPWGTRKRGQQPPDLDKLMRDVMRRFSSLFGGGRGGSGGGWGAFAWIPMLLVAIWLLTGFYQVDASERGVVLRFGQFKEVTLPGLHWHLPWPVESRYVVNVDEVRSHNHKTEMLTRDENLVYIDLVVQYRVSDKPDSVKEYLFNVRDPDQTLSDVSDSAIREVIGKQVLVDVLGGDTRQLISERTGELVQQTLDGYGSGLHVLSVNLQQVLLPQAVRSAADDVTRAREDRHRVINEAQAYANDIVPRARGEAARRIEEANAYREHVIAVAQGETQRFLQLLGEYRNAPNVTRERLYLETMERVLGGVPKVILNAEGSGNMIYLPIDKLLERRDVRDSGSSELSLPPTSGQQPDDTDGRTRERSRGNR